MRQNSDARLASLTDACSVVVTDQSEEQHVANDAPTNRFARLTQPNNPISVRQQIEAEQMLVAWRNFRHSSLAARWEAAASWTRVVVTLTSGISALSVLADSTAMATVFAVVTAAVAALNAGFNPSESAKKHRDSAREYGHLIGPLRQLVFKMDEFYGFQKLETLYDSTQGVYYEAPMEYSPAEKEELRDVWDAYCAIRAKIETIADSEPSLAKLWGGPQFLPSSSRRSVPDGAMRVQPPPPSEASASD